MIGTLVIVGLILAAVGVWLAVLSIRFLISGRKAFDRYLFMTSDPIRPVASHPSTRPPQPLSGHRKKWTTGAP